MAKSASSSAWGATFALGLFVSSVGFQPPDPPRQRAAVYSTYRTNDNFSQSDKKLLRRHCSVLKVTDDKVVWPVHAPGAALGPTRYVVRNGYALEHSSEFRYSLWVCAHLTRRELKDASGRLKPEPFAPDPELDNWPRSQLADYKGSKFARGHLTPDADHPQKRKADTYFLSNMVPQASNKFNSSVWKSMEEKVRAWAGDRGECWVITGAFVHDPAEDDVAQADGLVEYFTVGAGAVGVPTHLYKIIVAPRLDDPKKLESLAFVMENRSYDKGYDLTDYLFSIDWIEQRTGLNFMPDLTPSQEAELESVEADELWKLHDDD